MTNDFTEKLIDVTVLRAGGPSDQIVQFLRSFVHDTFDHKPSADFKFWPHLEDIFTCIDHPRIPGTISVRNTHHLI